MADLERAQFQKIILLNNMANSLISFAHSKGAENLSDYVDLTCGAIPEGPFEQIIDPGAPQQFLELYTGIAEFRMAVAVTKLLEMDQNYMPAISEFFFRTGTECTDFKPQNVHEALQIIQAVILDGMPETETKRILKESPESIQWEKLTDTHEIYWNKAGTNVKVYYELQTSLIKGLLYGSGILYENSNNLIFTLSK